MLANESMIQNEDEILDSFLRHKNPIFCFAQSAKYFHHFYSSINKIKERELTASSQDKKLFSFC